MKGSYTGLLTLSLVAVLLITGCMAGGQPGAAADKREGAEKGEYHAITQAAAKARMDSGDALVILDVRTQEEYDAGHIAGAILLPNERIGTEAPPELPDRNAEILVYCRSGNRSAQAAKKLADMGYTAVYDFGGVQSWPYGTVTE